MKLIVTVTGASGIILAKRLLETLKEKGIETHLICSDSAKKVAGIEKVIIIQNKIDAVTKEQALENYKQIKAFIKGTVAENAPIIPISAVFGANLNMIVRAFEKVIPSSRVLLPIL